MMTSERRRNERPHPTPTTLGAAKIPLCKTPSRNKGTVVERRPFDDGWLQLEYRVYKPTGRRSGPYCSFYWTKDGKRKREYAGRDLDAWMDIKSRK